MASILDILNTHNGEKFITKAVEKTSENKEKVSEVLAVGLPVLLGAIKKYMASKEGHLKVKKIMVDEKFEEDFFIKMDSIHASELLKNGDGILDQILGQNKEDVISLTSTTLGIQNSTVADILKMAAPMLISILASLKKKEQLDSIALEELIDSLLGASNKFDPSLIETLLAGKGDANIIKDAKGMILGGGNKGKKDGGLLDGMVGGK